MTIRQFAKENGIEIVGRLKKKSCEDEVFNYRTCEYMTEKTIYWEDEAGNTFLQIASQNGHLCHIRRPPCDLNGGHPRTH